MIGKIGEAARNMEAVWAEVKSTSEEITSGSRAQSESVEEAASSVNEMHYALKEIAGNVDDLHATSERTSSSVIEMAASIGEVAKTMADLSLSIEETSTAITQMSATIREVADNVEALSSAVEQTSASSTQISASVKEVEAAARQSAALAEAVASDAQDLGMRAIDKTIEGMGRIEANAQHSADVVNRLGERAESIGSILTVIEDITDQTGLLALNAAIIAAQAGEHGKGFAVVATEIRELANRTAASTKEIGTLIAAVQEETRQAVDAMREGGAIVQDGVRLAGNAGAALRKILESAGTSRDMSRSIDRAAAEQSRGMKQVSEAVQQINKMAHQFANAANEQKTGSEQIMRAAEKMRELTRFVKSSTDEQARAGKDIAAAMEQMSGKIGMVNRATGEVQAGSDLIVKSIDRIKEIAKANLDMAAGLNVAMDVMSRQSGALSKEIEKFRM
jgi:methyl-accepting chemotaxis protein